MIDAAYFEDSVLQLRKLKKLADKAIGQTEDQHLFVRLDPEANSIALIMKHIAGNMRSRWTDFLTADGEKPDRNRDSEFEEESETRAATLATWEDGWNTVMQAIGRQMTHYASHVGQIVFLAKHFAGSRWKSLSIPRGKSKDFEVAKDGRPYNVEQR